MASSIPSEYWDEDWRLHIIPQSTTDDTKRSKDGKSKFLKFLSAMPFGVIVERKLIKLGLIEIDIETVREVENNLGSPPPVVEFGKADGSFGKAMTTGAMMKSEMTSSKMRPRRNLYDKKTRKRHVSYVSSLIDWRIWLIISMMARIGSAKDAGRGVRPPEKVFSVDGGNVCMPFPLEGRNAELSNVYCYRYNSEWEIKEYLSYGDRLYSTPSNISIKPSGSGSNRSVDICITGVGSEDCGPYVCYSFGENQPLATYLLGLRQPTPHPGTVTAKIVRTGTNAPPSAGVANRGWTFGIVCLAIVVAVHLGQRPLYA